MLYKARAAGSGWPANGLTSADTASAASKTALLIHSAVAFVKASSLTAETEIEGVELQQFAVNQDWLPRIPFLRSEEHDFVAFARLGRVYFGCC